MRTACDKAGKRIDRPESRAYGTRGALGGMRRRRQSSAWILRHDCTNGDPSPSKLSTLVRQEAGAIQPVEVRSW